MENIMIKLNDGYEIPQLGLGTWLVTGEDCYNNVLNALKIGYRHIDTAEVYENLKEVGRAIRDSFIPRKEIYVTTKVWFTDYSKKNIEESINYQLEEMGLEYFDLVLLHKPYSNYLEGWKALVELKKTGKIHSIGVSNFNKKKLNKILSLNTVIPAVNQVECNCLIQRKEFKKYLAEYGIRIESASPLGHGRDGLLKHPVLEEIGIKYNKSTAQVALRWQIQENNIIVPKSLLLNHLQQNFEIYEFSLTEEEMEKIRALNKEKTMDQIPMWIQYIAFIFVGLKAKRIRRNSMK